MVGYVRCLRPAYWLGRLTPCKCTDFDDSRVKMRFLADDFSPAELVLLSSSAGIELTCTASLHQLE